jgi:hypothetical protein
LDLSEIKEYKEKRNFYKTWLVVVTRTKEYKFRMKNVKDATIVLGKLIKL